MVMHTTCRKNAIVTGRLGKDFSEQAFTEGKEYTLCYNSKNSNLFTLNDAGYMHFMTLNDNFFSEYFMPGEPVKIEEAGLSEFEERYYSRMFDERHSFMDTPEIEQEEGDY